MAHPQRKAAQMQTPQTQSQKALAVWSDRLERNANILSKARVYLSGPMDFVASRAEEKRKGWRSRVGQFLKSFGTTVYDPWNKPAVAGLPHYGKEDEFSANERNKWTYENTEAGHKTRATLCDHFWPTLHIDLRMVDTSDFVIAYCPTNVYSVGTVHEIVMARLECKPVLFVSPHISFPALDDLGDHLKGKRDAKGQALLERLITQASLHEDPQAIPSMWYMALIDGGYFFDGFGFARNNYMTRFHWQRGELDEREKRFPPKRPLLPYLEKLNSTIPLKYDLAQNRYIRNSDWLVFQLRKSSTTRRGSTP
jgi:hypothetical protein